MKISISSLKTTRQWRAATGLDKERFSSLLPPFQESYLKLFGHPLEKRLVDSGIDYCIHNEEDLLLFTLFSLKSGLSYDNLGFVAGMEASSAHKNQKIGIQVLGLTLRRLGYSPMRGLDKVTDFKFYFVEKGIENILLDASERLKQRPLDNKTQKEYYSGKKKAHTVKTLVISCSKKVIHYISDSVAGRIHDFSLMRKEFPRSLDYFSDLRGKVDLGFLGIVDQYNFKSIQIPHKKKKKTDLSERQKEENKELASERVLVEHSLGWLKRYRLLSDRLRIHHTDFYNEILEVCAGLWNFHLAR